MIIVSHMRDAGYHPRGIVHVGSNLAQEMGAYISLRPELIVWIEADPDTFANLQTRITDDLKVGPPRQICINAVISEANGLSVQFKKFNNNSESSSIFGSTELLRKTWAGLKETGEVLELKTRRLDDTLAEAGLSPADVDVLIVDIQGAELLALRGAGEFLSHVRYLEVELSKESIYEGAPLAGEVEAFLKAAGFVRETEMPWHGDAVYRRAT